MRGLAAAIAVVLAGAGCDSLPGKPSADLRYVRPAEVTDFVELYGTHCTGCHGDDTRPGAAVSLADPLYLAIAGDAAIRRALVDGVPGTAMPSFGRRGASGLMDAQVDAIVGGIRARWGRTDALAGATAPPYAAPLGDAERGRDPYATYCAGCHGADGDGGEKAGSIVDGSYLSLVSDQHLRTTVIVGRPKLGMPDWRGYVAGRPMTAEEIADVVAWLAAQRVPLPGQPYAAGVPGSRRAREGRQGIEDRARRGDSRGGSS